MAINPPLDILSDVARAADPARYQVAVQKLSEGAGSVDEAGFDKALQTAGVSQPSMGFDAYSLRSTLKSNSALSSPQQTAASYQKFEAFVLQTFIEAMMPKDAKNTFGKGMAGSIWKSMMAEQLSAEIAKAGGVGIAKSLAGTRKAQGAEPVT